MATFTVDTLVGKIISLLESKASLLGGVRAELSEMKRELESMRAFLEDANGKRGLTGGELTWVSHVRDTAYDVEDIIDEFMYHLNTPQAAGEGHNKFTSFIYKTFNLPKNLLVRHQIATKLRKFNTMIKSIPERHRRYGVDGIQGSSSCHDHNHKYSLGGESCLFLSDGDVVGIEDDRDLLLRLMTDHEEEPRRAVISVVGMGGSGKTTLVAKAYNNPTVKRHFDSYAWITISQTYVIEDLFRSMIKEFYQATRQLIPSELSVMSYRQLVEMLVNYLEQKRYVVVLDDVWNMNLWTEIKVSLPDGRHGSRILLTTRKQEIATSSFGTGSHVHYMQPLGMDEAWVLFCEKAFSSSTLTNCNSSTRSTCCPEELESIGRDLVGKCKGLPLAIVALGGLMSTKKLEWEWSKVRNSLNWELSNNPMLEAVKSILFLSFNDLSYRLKQCFLYCCVFPEDSLIGRKRLIRLWMAEGFVEEIRGVTPEEVAEGYFIELIHRSMLQVVRRNPFGRPKECKMHDVMRELALSTSEREKFCIVYDGSCREDNTTILSESEAAHRLSIQIGGGGGGGEMNRMKLLFGTTEYWSRLRSLFVFSRRFVDVASYGFKLLRVLDMEDVPIDKLPDGLVNLFNLRYLNLKNTLVKELPKSIGRLRNLQTLNIDWTEIESLPSSIIKLQNLRHLIMSRVTKRSFPVYSCGIKLPPSSSSDISKLKKLQVLSRVKADEGNIIAHAKNMTQLTNFGVTDVKEADMIHLCTAIQNMKLLHHLFVAVTNQDEVLRMETLSLPPPQLHTLFLAGMLEKVPAWFHSLQNLTNLVLHWSRLREDHDPLPFIQALPNLVSLTLAEAYEGKQLWFREGFGRLEVLEIRACEALNEIIIDKGVMQGLQILILAECEELKTLPQGIEHLTSLQDMRLIIVSNELIERIRGEESVDRIKVGHIPKINHAYLTSSRRWFRESLSLNKYN